MNNKVTELRARLSALQKIVQMSESTVSWRDKYSQVFSDAGSRRIYALFKDLNLDFSYYDPNLDYEDDVRAFVNALERRIDELQPMLDALSSSDLPELKAVDGGQWIAVYFASPPRMAVADTEEAAIEAVQAGYVRRLHRDEISVKQFVPGQAFEFSDD